MISTEMKDCRFLVARKVPEQGGAADWRPGAPEHFFLSLFSQSSRTSAKDTARISAHPVMTSPPFSFYKLSVCINIWQGASNLQRRKDFVPI